MAKTLRGRFWVAAWLVFFLGVSVVVIARQTASHVAATELADLAERRSVLEARRAQLLGRIREARSRARLIPVAESLGLRLAADTQIVNLELEGEGN